MTLNIPLIIVGKAVLIKPIISYRHFLRAKLVLRKLTRLDRNLQTDYYKVNIHISLLHILIKVMSITILSIVLPITSIMTNTMTANSLIIASVI